MGPWGVTLPLDPWRREWKEAEEPAVRHLSPLTRPPWRQPPGGWEAEMWPVPTVCPQRKQASRWWASWGLGPPRPSSAGHGRPGQVPPGLSFCVCDQGHCSSLPRSLGARQACKSITPLYMWEAGTLNRAPGRHSRLPAAGLMSRPQEAGFRHGSPQTGFSPRSNPPGLGELRTRLPFTVRGRCKFS